MFHCDACKELSKKHEPMHKLVLKKRDKKYVNAGIVTAGWEIVRELSVCGECFKLTQEVI